MPSQGLGELFKGDFAETRGENLNWCRWGEEWPVIYESHKLNYNYPILLCQKLHESCSERNACAALVCCRRNVFLLSPSLTFFYQKGVVLGLCYFALAPLSQKYIHSTCTNTRSKEPHKRERKFYEIKFL